MQKSILTTLGCLWLISILSAQQPLFAQQFTQSTSLYQISSTYFHSYPPIQIGDYSISHSSDAQSKVGLRKRIYLPTQMDLHMNKASDTALQVESISTQSKSSYPLSQSSYLLESKPLPKRMLGINPLGVLQFGPVFQGEFRLTEQGYLMSHVRIPYLGLLYHIITIGGEENVTVSPLALGLGAGYKSLFLTQKGAFYIGGLAEYSFGSSTGNDGSDWESHFSNVALLANGGYRWRWPEKKYVLSLGAYMGAYTALKDEWYYTASPAEPKDERSTTLLFMIELTFGWER
ncbi:hypothetical protein [Xanthocytophaga agilis]|uniref:Outer membrane protein beta-barrel domain-containing protein n=1 Tax=Xanthocytophaga agilis TaxID=3048010 RepID=A0AAE3UHT3_9BACT|nr:hypothetical protein [Xanthocytophaga agilis]MDJ1505815.1 hypothetical protein [Xanthocytophaga agilis]